VRMEATVKCEPSFDELVELHRPRVFRFALASLRDRDAAESVTQDCFLRAYKARDSFRGDSSLQTWLMQIAVNLIRDAARSRRFQFWRRAQHSAVPLDRVDGAISPEERISTAQQVEAIRKLIDRLSPNQRAVFLLHFMEEMDASEIEIVTGISKAAIKVHLFRAIRAVRKRLRYP
jgi:RNA polymerase sigma-70 factor (ECF subfamily)